MRPATPPPADRTLTASVTGPDLLAPRMIRDRAARRVRLRRATRSAAVRQSARARSEPTRWRTRRDHLGGAVPEDDLAVAVERATIPLSDVGGSRPTAPARARRAGRARRWRGDGRLLAATASSASTSSSPSRAARGVDSEQRQSAVPSEPPTGAGEGGMSRLEHRVESPETLVVACLRKRDGSPTRRTSPEGPSPPAGLRESSAASAPTPSAAVTTQLTRIKYSEGGGLRVDERRRLLRDLVGAAAGSSSLVSRPPCASAAAQARGRARPRTARFGQRARGWASAKWRARLEVVVAERAFSGEDEPGWPVSRGASPARRWATGGLARRPLCGQAAAARRPDRRGDENAS